MTSNKPHRLNATAEQKKRRRLKRGYLQYSDVIGILGFCRGEFARYIRIGAIPPPESCPECNYYTVEQLQCLIQAKFHATIDRERYVIFSLKMFGEYVKEHWPLGDEERLVLEGKKEKRWRRAKRGKSK